VASTLTLLSASPHALKYRLNSDGVNDAVRTRVQMLAEANQGPLRALLNAVGRWTKDQSVAAVTPGATVFVSLGTNDATKASSGAQIGKLAAAIRSKGAARIVWLIPPATRPLPGLANIRDAIAQTGVELAHTTVALRPDGLHPSNYATAARDVLRVLG